MYNSIDDAYYLRELVLLGILMTLYQVINFHPSTTIKNTKNESKILYRVADKSLARPVGKQAWKHVRDVRDFNNIETRAVIKFFISCKARRRRKFTPF